MSIAAATPRLRPFVEAFLGRLTGTWQVVLGGARHAVTLASPGPYSDSAVIVIFDRTAAMPASVAVVNAGATLATRKGSMPLDADAAARLNALSKVRRTFVFGLRPVAGDRGPLAAFAWQRQAEMHIRLVHFNGADRDPIRCFTPETVVFRHFDWMLEHCGIVPVHRDGVSVTVPFLGPLLGVCPRAVSAIPRGTNDPESELRLSRTDSGWRVPLPILYNGLAARAAKWLAPGLETLYEQYCGNPDLGKPLRRNKRRATELASSMALPKCFVSWFKGLEQMQHEERMVFARFANSTGNAQSVYALAEQERPDLVPKLREARGFTKMTTEGCEDVRSGRYAHVKLFCDCVPPTPASEAASPFHQSPCQAPAPKKAHFRFSEDSVTAVGSPNAL